MISSRFGASGATSQNPAGTAPPSAMTQRATMQHAEMKRAAINRTACACRRRAARVCACRLLAGLDGWAATVPGRQALVVAYSRSADRVTRNCTGTDGERRSIGSTRGAQRSRCRSAMQWEPRYSAAAAKRRARPAAAAGAACCAVSSVCAVHRVAIACCMLQTAWWALRVTHCALPHAASDVAPHMPWCAVHALTSSAGTSASEL